MSYYFGIDNGGTAAKAAVFDERGRELAAADMEMCRFNKPVFQELFRAEVYDRKYALYCRTIEMLDDLRNSMRKYKDEAGWKQSGWKVMRLSFLLICGRIR